MKSQVRYLDELISNADADLRVGRRHGLQVRIGAMNMNRIPRGYRLPLAKLCRRAGLYSGGLRLLTPIVHPRRRTPDNDPTSSELAEYAVLLSRIGSVHEAFWTLDHVDKTESPEVGLFRAQMHFGRWEYEAAIPELRAYLQSAPAPYQKLVANVNLAAAFVHTQDFNSAFDLIDINIENARLGDHRRLWANSLELKSEALIQRGAYTEAEPLLDQALQLLDAQPSDDNYFYLIAWKKIVEGLRNGEIEPLLKLRAEAESRKLWERFREIDLYICKIQPTKKRFEHLVYGTPFPHFRARVLRETGLVIESESFNLGKFGSSIMDIETGLVDGGELDFGAGKKIHQLLDVALRDFYRPTSIGGLFSELCPEERFHVLTSPARMHQLISRTRTWLKDRAIPVSIEGENGIAVRINGDFSFKIPLHRQPLDRFQAYWNRLHGYYAPGTTFTAREARDRLGLKSSTFKSLVRWAREQGLIEQHGQSVQVSYLVRG